VLSIESSGRGNEQRDRLLVYVSWAQALYYVLTGVWSLVSIRTFQMVTGPKVDTWLVKTVGVLVIVIGAVLGMAAARRQWTPEIPLLATGSAAGLAGIDVVYVAQKRISPVYLLDALAEVLLIAMWAIAWPKRNKG
jgi:hypothetical protein